MARPLRVPTLQEFFGTDAGLSAANITRPMESWQQERESFTNRDLSGRDYVHVWVDGIHTGVRLGGDDRARCLVMVGARLDGKKELVASRMATRSPRRVGRSC
jgi:transposase-like protein